jgi:hypothetical protein
LTPNPREARIAPWAAHLATHRKADRKATLRRGGNSLRDGHSEPLDEGKWCSRLLLTPLEIPSSLPDTCRYRRVWTGARSPTATPRTPHHPSPCPLPLVTERPLQCPPRSWVQAAVDRIGLPAGSSGLSQSSPQIKVVFRVRHANTCRSSLRLHAERKAALRVALSRACRQATVPPSNSHRRRQQWGNSWQGPGYQRSIARRTVLCTLQEGDGGWRDTRGVGIGQFCGRLISGNFFPWWFHKWHVIPAPSELSGSALRGPSHCILSTARFVRPSLPLRETNAADLPVAIFQTF